MAKDLIVDAENMYRLFENERGKLSLGVMCGGIAMYEVAFTLSEEEIRKYQDVGKGFLDALSLEVAKHPENFEFR